MTYKVQIDDTIRDATPDEAARIQESHALAEQQKNQLEERAKALESARAKLAKLGLTDDELEAFLGV